MNAPRDKRRVPTTAAGASSSVTRPPVSAGKERWAKVIVRVYAVASVLAVVLWLLRLVRPSFTHWPTVVLGALNIPLTPSLVSVVALFLLTGGLIRRKRIALVLVAVLQLAGLFTSAAILAWASRPDDELSVGSPMAGFEVGLEVVGVLVAVAALWLTWWVRHAFPARTRQGSGGAASLTLIIGVAVSVALTHVLLLATTDTAVDDWSVLGTALLRALGVRSGGPRFRHTVPDWIPVLTSIVLALTLIAALYVFLRPSRRNEAWSGEKEVAVRGLLVEYGQSDSLGYFATRRDKELIFSPNGRAAVAYRVVGAVCLASGDPIGDPASWARAVTAWKTFVRRFGWVPGVLAASEAGARAYATAGLSVTALGDEAVLHSNRFSLANTAMTDVRRAVRRARRAGLTVQVRRQGELDPAELASLGELANAWRGGASDRGFSMALNRWGDPVDEQCVVVTAHHGDESVVVGLLSFVPWGRRGLSLDVMRRAPEAPNGTTELMVAEVMKYASTSGIGTVSLNFAMLRGVFADAERLGAGGIIRFNSTVLGFFDRFFQLESLYRSSARYRPEWVPRYLCFDGTLALMQVAIAAARVEGFLPAPFADHPPHPQLSLEELRQVRALGQALPEVRAVSPRRTDQFRHRLRHAQLLSDAGLPPYPVGVAATVSVARLVVSSAREISPDRQAEPKRSTYEEVGAQTLVRVYGRLRAIRRHGGVVFSDLTDAGVTVQAILERQVLGADHFRLLSRALDSGDLVVVSARMGHSRTGTPSLLVRELTVVAKALHPIPYGGFENAEARLRQRSTDLLVHPQSLDVLARRSAAVAAVRGLLAAEGYREVQTPMLTSVHGGASARPFRTYINAYGADLTLRIAPELFLKRLLVAGAGPIFEMGRNFRNEGADATHNPEFTSLEAYRPFADYHDMRELTEQLVKAAATAVHGAPLLPLCDIRDRTAVPMLTDVTRPWPVVTMTAAVSRAVGREVSMETDFEELLSVAAEHGIRIGPGAGPGAVLEELYGELVEPTTIVPTFYIDFPAETSPLTAPHRCMPGLAERWDLVANGMEIGTAYSELTDPVEQRNRLTEQSVKAAAGDLEAMEVDEDFLYALETGMPPSGGLGIGVDRLVMLLTGTTIREVITFPFVRPVPHRR